jgi:hypothetical protein
MSQQTATPSVSNQTLGLIAKGKKVVIKNTKNGIIELSIDGQPLVFGGSRDNRLEMRSLLHQEAKRCPGKVFVKTDSGEEALTMMNSPDIPENLRPRLG